jgi:hypothetical protein
MTKFGDLLGGKIGAAPIVPNNIPPVLEDNPPEPIPVPDPSTNPIQDVKYELDTFTTVPAVAEGGYNPLDSMPVATIETTGLPDFKSMTKVELEEFGRTVGIELDRRQSQSKLVKQIKKHLGQ